MTEYCYWERCPDSSIRLIVANHGLNYYLDTLAIIYVSEKYWITAEFYKRDELASIEQTEYFPYPDEKDAVDFLEKLATERGFKIVPKEMLTVYCYWEKEIESEDIYHLRLQEVEQTLRFGLKYRKTIGYVRVCSKTNEIHARFIYDENERRFKEVKEATAFIERKAILKNCKIISDRVKCLI